MKSVLTKVKGLKRIRGVIVPVVTPVTARETVHESEFRKVLRRCMAAGVNGIFVGGSAGMGPLFPDAEWQRLMTIAHDEVGDRCALLAGVMTPSTGCALERIRVLDTIGYRTMVVTPTFYLTLRRDEEFLAHFAACRAATNMEMVLYNIPSCTGSSIPVKVLIEAARRGWTRTCKESSGDRRYFADLLKKGAAVGLEMLQGNEPDMAWALARGAAGLVPVCANYDPAAFVAAWQASAYGDAAALRRAQAWIDVLREHLVVGDKNWLAGVMHAVARVGIGSGRPLRPLQPVRGAEQRRMDAFLKR
jgi:4-hydroxy-tetrahydrodipicolinate synthase